MSHKSKTAERGKENRMNVQQLRTDARKKCQSDGIESSWVAMAKRERLLDFLNGGWNPGDSVPGNDNGNSDAKPTPSNDSSPTPTIGGMEKAIGDYASEKVLADMKTEYAEVIDEMIEERVQEVTAPIKIAVKDKVIFDEIDGDLIHFQFQDCLDKLNTFGKLFMVGARGTGKSTIAEQLFKVFAEMKQWDTDEKKKYTYAVGTAGVSEAQLLGKSTFDGRYIEGQYVHPFSKGGFIVADEFNGFDPNMSLIHNSMLDGQGIMFTPNDPETPYRIRHDDLFFIAIDNTSGYGNDFSYVGRNQQDLALLDRFTSCIIDIDYDNAIEKKLVGEYTELADSLFELRRRIKDNKLRYNISTRAFVSSAQIIHSAVNGGSASKSVTPMSLGKDKKIQGGLMKSSIGYCLADLTAQWTDEEKSKIDLIGLMMKYDTNYTKPQPRLSSLDNIQIKQPIQL